MPCRSCKRRHARIGAGLADLPERPAAQSSPRKNARIFRLRGRVKYGAELSLFFYLVISHIRVWVGHRGLQYPLKYWLLGSYRKPYGALKELWGEEERSNFTV